MAYKKSKKRKFSAFSAEGNSQFDIYKRGAFAGAVIGGVAGLVLGKKILLCIAIGAIAGGYINAQINKEESSSLKNFKRKQNKNNEDENDDTE